ncbi:type VII secretion protein EssA [Bacillus licheniformis]|nr:type VII secretion protein EssA [Bacillus licheniformis]
MAVMLSFFLFTPIAKAEETDKVDVKPNEYEKQDIKIETDYLQEEEAEYKEEISIPEELKEFSFTDSLTIRYQPYICRFSTELEASLHSESEH